MPMPSLRLMALASSCVVAASAGRQGVGNTELAFARMNGGRPVLSKKRQPDGFEERLKLLRKHGFKARIERLPGAARDDILDAIAVCRTATLIAAGTATRLGPARARDRYGLPMNIWY